MKRYALIALMLAVCLLAACAQPDTSPSPTAAATPSAKTTPVPTATPSPTTVATLAPVASDVPSAEADDEPAINANRTLYEDADSIYYLSPWYAYVDFVMHNGLYRISKADGSAAILASNVSCLYLSDESLYYATCEASATEAVCNTVCRYDTATGKTKTLFTQSADICLLAVYGDQLYYTANPNPGEGEFYSDIYRCDFDGRGATTVMASGYSFAFHGGMLYCTLVTEGDFVPLLATRLGACDVQEPELTPQNESDNFEVNSGALCYYGGGLSLYDVGSDKTRAVLNDCSAPGFAILGQYVLYLSGAQGGDALSAADTATGETYLLAPLSEYLAQGDLALHTGNSGAYLSANDGAGSFALWRIAIEDGHASITPVAEASAAA